MDRLLVAFAVGVSFAASFVTQTYLAVGTRGTVGTGLLVGVRLAYGLANIVLVHLGNSVAQAVAVGAVLGLCLSLVGRFALHLPTQLFGFSAETAWKVHVLAPVLYAAIFVVVVRNLNRVVGL